jgi:hypothetical protein
MRLWWLCTTAANIAWESCPREPRYTERTGVWRLDRLANRSFGRRVLPRQISNFPLCLAVAFPESPSRARHRSPLARMLFSALWSNPALRPMDQTARAESMHACLRLIQHQRQISSWVAPSCLDRTGGSDKQTPKLESVLSALPVAMVRSRIKTSVAECHSLLFVCQETPFINL